MFVRVFYIFDPTWTITITGYIRRDLFMYLFMLVFMKIGGIKAMLCIGAHVRFCPFFPHLLSDLREIRYSSSAHSAAFLLSLSRISPQGRPCFRCGRE
jgi:hypothetical protein